MKQIKTITEEIQIQTEAEKIIHKKYKREYKLIPIPQYNNKYCFTAYDNIHPQKWDQHIIIDDEHKIYYFWKYDNKLYEVYDLDDSIVFIQDKRGLVRFPECDVYMQSPDIWTTFIFILVINKGYCLQEIIEQFFENYDVIEHPELQNKEGKTVAMILANLGIIPPKEWYHDPALKDRYGHTVAMYFVDRKINPPKEWEHSPELQDQYGNTVAMYLVYYYGIIPPKEWQHSPELQSKLGWTVAMRLARRRVIPPQEWRHDPELQSKLGETVAIMLTQRGIMPPKEWQYQTTIDTIELDDTCTVCYSEGKQTFVKTKCYPHHLICQECYNTMIINGMIDCPYCRKQGALIQ